MECLLYPDEQLKQYCQGLNDKERQDLYKRVLEKAKETIENTKDISQIKMLSRAAVVIEETTDKELLEPFNDDHPFRDVNIVTYSPEGNANYLFSIGDSSELYDVKEDREKALYQAIKSNDVEIIKHLLVILVPEDIFLERPIELEISTHEVSYTYVKAGQAYKLKDMGTDDIRKIDLKYLQELEVLLQQFYEELKPGLTKDMENYLKKKLKFYNFLCNAKVNEKNLSGLIKLFSAQSEINYQIDLLLLSLIAENMEKEELRKKINNMIDLLEKYRKFEELEYKVRRLKLELADGKADKESLEKQENEMREIEAKYIKVTDLAGERDELVKQLQQ